jgi:hypothetical protein
LTSERVAAISEQPARGLAGADNERAADLTDAVVDAKTKDVVT